MTKEKTLIPLHVTGYVFEIVPDFKTGRIKNGAFINFVKLGYFPANISARLTTDLDE